MGFISATTKTVHELNAQPSNINECFTPGQQTPSLGGQTPSPELDADGPGPTPITPGASHQDLGFLLRRRCMDDKAAVRKATLTLMKKSTALLCKPPDDTMLEAMCAACSDPMVSIKKAALFALSEEYFLWMENWFRLENSRLSTALKLKATNFQICGFKFASHSKNFRF